MTSKKKAHPKLINLKEPILSERKPNQTPYRRQMIKCAFLRVGIPGT